jgi:hypothetical protein
MACITATVLACDRQSNEAPASAGATIAGAEEDRGLRGSLPFSDAQMYFEYNSTDDDAGIQVFLDAEGWKEVSIRDRSGTEMLEIETGGGMRELGLTELRFEGAEPSPAETFAAFPAGTYRFRGVTIDDQRLMATVHLSQDMPAAPVVSPSHGETVDPDDVVVTWEPVGGVDRYQVIVESDANNLSLEVSVSSSTLSLHVPPTYLFPNTEYKVEVLAIATNGNRTITEGTFFTGP